MPNSQHILLVEDNNNFSTLVQELLTENGFIVTSVTSGEEALKEIQNNGNLKLVLLDLRLPGISGMDVLREISEHHPDLAVLVVSGHGDIQTAVEAIKMGAYDFLEKPTKSERLLLTVQRALDFVQLQEDRNRLLEDIRNRYQLIGASSAMRQILSIVDRVAKTDVTILITGESGTGKEMVANAIHLNSRRATRPFVQVNCAAIPDTLVESELFGHVKGAFTGALHSHDGYFQQANGGTLFLDEIGDLTLSAQAKVLRAIETRQITKVGGEKSEQVDIRLIVATRQDLVQMVSENRFREDLFHRINVVPIHIPPLRERPDDILPLAEFFLKKFSTTYGRKAPILRSDAQAILMGYSWPGNVRELRNVMEKIMILSNRDEIHGNDLAFLMQGPFTPESSSEKITYHRAKETFERHYILTQLRLHNWNITRTAESIGVERSYLYKIMQRLGIRGKEGETGT